MVKKITGEQYKALPTEGIKLIDFNATWCGPCQMLKPVLEEVSEEYAGKLDFYAIDTDESPALAQEFLITSIPALAIVKDGKLAEMNVGFVPKDQVKAFIDKNL